MKIRPSSNLGARVLVVALLAAGPMPAAADPVPEMYWTHVGSAGTVDSADLSSALFDFDVITNVGPGAGTVDVRYNVVSVDGLSGFSFDGFLVARYLDQGSLSRVVARLWQVSIDTGERTEVAVLDSDAFSAQSTFQTQQVLKCGIPFDFTRNTYYVGVQLVRGTAAGFLPGRPALAALQIKPVPGYFC